MARWEITGADRNTGEDRTFSIDAATKRDAILLVKDRNVLISDVRCTIPDEPHLPSQPSPTIKPVAAPGNPPDYEEIIAGAAALKICAGFSNALGVLSLIAAAIVCVVCLSHGELIQGVTALISLGVWGAWCLILAIILGMLASVGEALRDTARNSFKP